MAAPTLLMGLGMHGGLATEICGRVANTLTATGTTQTDALLLPATVNVFTTTASGTGARLPPFEVSAGFIVANLGANALLLYPPVGGTINGGAANAAVSIAAGKTAQVWVASGTAAIAQIGA